MIRELKRALGVSFSLKAAMRNPGIYRRQMRLPRRRFRDLARQALLAAGKGTVVQIGANDGQRNDPLAELILRGGAWIERALLVEPQGAAFDRLRRRYADTPHVTCVHAAVDWQDGERALYRLDPQREVAQGNRPHPDSTASFARRHVVEEYLRRVPRVERAVAEAMVVAEPVAVRPLGALLAEHGIARPTVMLIDTEGFDGEILRMVAAGGCWPAVLQYEHKHLARSERRSVARMLVAHGYRLRADHADVWGERSVA